MITKLSHLKPVSIGELPDTCYKLKRLLLKSIEQLRIRINVELDIKKKLSELRCEGMFYNLFTFC